MTTETIPAWTPETRVLRRAIHSFQDRPVVTADLRFAQVDDHTFVSHAGLTAILTNGPTLRTAIHPDPYPAEMELAEMLYRFAEGDIHS